MTEFVIKPAVADDYTWLRALWDKHADVLRPWPAAFAHKWSRYLKGREPSLYIDVCQPARGFQAYAVTADHRIISYGMAVAEKRTGVGRALRLHLRERFDYPLTAVIKVDNLASLALHDSLGWHRIGTTVDSLTGDRMIIVCSK